MYTPLAIANFFIQKSFDTGQELTPMKLVKLIYIAHGWYLGLHSNPLIDEGVQAWKYGPIVNSVYHNFKTYGNSQISAPKYIVTGGQQILPIIKEDTRPFLEKIWEVYGKMNGLQLSTLTHQPNTPWDIIWNQQGGKQLKSVIIPNDLIRDYYKHKANAASRPA